MADPINATAILAAAHTQAVIDAAPTDQSLNAGALLPSEPIDELNFEVAADPSVIRETLAKLDQEPAVAQESNYNALSYLRDDLLVQKGMTQRIATEAMSILPNFCKGRPVNFYSRHPSRTGYDLALEEIDAGMAGEVIYRLEAEAQRYSPSIPSDVAPLNEVIDFKRRADQVSMMANLLRDFIRIATDNGFNWDDGCFRGCAVDPSQNVTVPQTLKSDKQLAYSFASMDDYYSVHLQGHALLERMTVYLTEWNTTFQEQLQVLKDGGTRSVGIPKPGSVTFNTGKTVSIENGQDMFRVAYDNRRYEFDDLTTLQWLTDVGNAAQQARVQDIVNGMPDYEAKRAELKGTLLAVAQHLKDNPSDSGSINPLITKFTLVTNVMNQTRDELIKFCMNAALATSYAGALGARVVEHAWKSVNQCKTTLQMSEAAYTELKLLVQDMQTPQKTNVL